WPLQEMYEAFRRAEPYRALTMNEFEPLVQMLAEGYATRRGRRGAYLHYDAVTRVLRGRRGAKLTAVTNAGVIPDQFDYDVVHLPAAAAQQLALYLGAAKAALSVLPDETHIVFERFFDEVGDTHLVIHSPYGSRINKAWGLALRKRFCRKFNFELQASALEDSI